MRRGSKHYSQQADYAGYDGSAGRDQPESAFADEGDSMNLSNDILEISIDLFASLI